MNLEAKILSNLHLTKKFVVTTDYEWTYSDLKHHVLYANNKMCEIKASRIIICSKQSFYSYSLILSSFLSKIIFCPINPNVSLARKIQIASDFQPDIIFCDEKDNLLTENHIFGSNVLGISSFFNQINSFHSTKLLSRFENEIAYTIYTSGSTGVPKGVKVKRSAINKLILWAIEEFDITIDDIYGQFAPIYFDMSMLDIFGGAAAGATLVPFAELSDKLFPARLIQRHKITFWNSVPQFINILENSKQLSKEYLSSLKKVKLGGDKTYCHQLSKLFQVVPNLKVILTYGPTEVTIFCTFLKVDISNYIDLSDKLMPIGKCVPGWNIILDETDEGIGEIVVYGNYIAEGYFSHNSSNFRNIEVENTLYSAFFTGDYGYKKNNLFYFAGRKDSQIKINGNRFDLTEIDYQMKNIGCTDSQSLYHEGKILLFFITNSNNFLTKEIVEEHLKSNLPLYGIPNYIKILSRMPLYDNGKVDKNKLVEIFKSQLNEE